MKMKNEGIVEARKWKTVLKNLHLFVRTALSFKRDFIPSLKKLYFTYSPLKDELGFSLELASGSLQHAQDIIQQCKDLFDDMPSNRRIELLEKIDEVLYLYDFGEEWREPLITIAISGILCPPAFNLYLDKQKLRTNRNLYFDLISRGKPRVLLALNPDTSIDDIKNAWPEIVRLQHSIRPKFKDFNLTKKSTEALIEQVHFLNKKHVSEKEKYAGLSLYEEQLWKSEERHGKSQEEIMKLLQKRAKESGSLPKTSKIKKQKTDREVVREMHPKKSRQEVDRMTNRIKKERQRLKR